MDTASCIVAPRGCSLLLLFALSCTGPVTTTPDDGPATTHTGQPTAFTGPDPFTSTPVVEMNTYFAAPLVGSLTVTTARPTTLRIEIAYGDRQITLTEDTAATDHDVQLLGFRADRAHTVTVTAIEGADEVAWPDALGVTTDPLPPDFPEISLISTTADREPGIDLFHVDSEPATRPEYIIAVDGQGEVVWYHAARKPVNHVMRRTNGNFVFMPDRYWMEEVDIWGRTIRHLKSSLDPDPDNTDVVIDTWVFHHDVIELPNGNLLFIGLDLVEEPNYPADEAVPGATAETLVAYDSLVEIDDAGAVVNEIHMKDVVDPLRIGYDSVVGTWWTQFAGVETKDWSHANAVVYRPDDSSVLMSLRHQDAVVKMDYPSGALQWIMAPPVNWSAPLQPSVLTATGVATRQHYHQHGAKWTPDGNVIMFDNGNYQASAFEPKVPSGDIDSRAVEYRVDEKAGTFEQVWSWDELSEPNFSAGLGNVEVLPTTGHVLITYGAAGGSPDHDARIIEVDKDTGAVIHDLAIGKGSGRVYRAVRLPSLYIDGTPID